MQQAPPPPAPAGLSFRAFAGEADFPAMCACANASFAADGMEIVRTVADMTRDYAAFTNCKPAEDVWIADAGNEIAGYVRSWDWVQADGARLYGQLGVVAPRWRRRGVGTALHAWLEQRQRAVAATHPEAAQQLHHAFVTPGEHNRIALLQRAGYEPVRYFIAMVRPTLGEIADFPLPPGLELRPPLPEHYRTIWDGHVKCFEAHWGFAPPDEHDYQGWLTAPNFQPHLWQVAWDTRSGEVAGQVRTFISAQWNEAQGRRRGWTEFISVGEQWRRQGLARALISHSLRAQKAQGMTESGLGVDADNASGATRVYEACGFAVDKRNVVYRKRIALPAG